MLHIMLIEPSIIIHVTTKNVYTLIIIIIIIIIL